MEPFDALDEDLDEAQPHAPAGLHAFGERLLARAAELELDDRAGPTVEQRLLRVLRAVGRVEHGRGEQTSLVDGDLLQPAGEWDSEARENRTREFVCWLADQLAQAAGLAIELALAVYGAVSPECVQRSEIVADIRTELLEELGYASDALTRWGPLGLDAREAGREARIVLESVAHELALAAYFWAEDTMPGEAGLQAVEIAAQLLAHAHRTATTADYDDWLE